MFSQNRYPHFPIDPGINFLGTSASEAKAYFNALISVIPERIALLRSELSLEQAIDPWNPVGIERVLSILSEELQRNAAATNPKPESVQVSVDLSEDLKNRLVDYVSSQKTVLHPALDAFCIDCSLLFSEIVRARNPHTYWGVVKGKNRITQNAPALLGLGSGRDLRPLTFAAYDVIAYVNGRIPRIDLAEQFRKINEGHE